MSCRVHKLYYITISVSDTLLIYTLTTIYKKLVFIARYLVDDPSEVGYLAQHQLLDQVQALINQRLEIMNSGKLYLNYIDLDS